MSLWMDGAPQQEAPQLDQSSPSQRAKGTITYVGPDHVFHTRVNSSPTSTGAVEEAGREVEWERRTVNGSKGERDRQ